MTKLDKYDKASVSEAMNELWSLLTAEEQKMFLTHMSVYRYRRNEMIYHEGESPDYLLCLLSGKVKIYRDGYGGRSIINRVLRPVQYFGYRASMAGEPYVTAAAAFEDSLVAWVPMNVVYRAMKTNNQLCAFFIRALAVDLGLADKRMVSLTQKHVRARLAETLLTLSEIYGFTEDGETLNSLITRENMASFSNMTTSNAIRTLMSFAKEGLVEVDGRKIRLLDVDKLLAVSEQG